MSNVKQMGTAAMMYVQDYDEHFPLASVWMDATLPYSKHKSIYRCPQNHSSLPTDFGYAFNTDLSLKALASYKTPEKVVQLYDANDLRWNANALGRAGIANPPRHAGGNIVGFAEGHAKLENPAEKDR